MFAPQKVTCALHPKSGHPAAQRCNRHGPAVDIQIIELAASVHRDLCTPDTIQQALEVEACEWVLRLLSKMRCERRDGARVACFKLGKRLQITLRGGIIVLFGPKRFEGTQGLRS